ncbi:MAG TPA: hypothetical protein VJ783_02180 [Pirellulales bacterium]|nr:hypothetical protein [Pirellulales bacterium]
MDQTSATALFASLAEDKRLSMLANLSYQLTIVARDTYGADGAVKDAKRLRAVNEIQHRLTAALRTLAQGGNGHGIPNDLLAVLFFAERDDATLARLLAFAFEQAAASVVGIPLPKASAV